MEKQEKEIVWEQEEQDFLDNFKNFKKIKLLPLDLGAFFLLKNIITIRQFICV